MLGKRGNPNWGKAGPALVPRIVTEFEIQVRQLKLQKHDYVASPQLLDWCLQNKDRRYIPEWLLEAWNIEVDVHYSTVTWSHRQWA
jgi:hypothetical protein